MCLRALYVPHQLLHPYSLGLSLGFGPHVSTKGKLMGIGLAFTCLCAEPGSGPSERGEHRPFEWGRCVCGGLSSALGVVRCGCSAGCVLCVLWAISAAMGGRSTLWG